jgi:hypothetical protein
MDFVLDKMALLRSEFGKVVCMKVVGIYLSFPPKEK